MRLAPVLTAALFTLGMADPSLADCPDGIGETEDHLLPATRDAFRRTVPGGDQALHRRLAAKLGVSRLAQRASGQSFAPWSTQNGQCIDVQNNNLNNGARVQIWQCGGGANQQWRLEGPLFQTNNNMCLDLPSGHAYNGAPLQVWQCDGSNANQHWSVIGSTLQWAGSSFCVDVTGGWFNNGNLLQLWTCYPGSANQAFSAAAAVNSGSTLTVSSSGSTDFYGYTCISLDAFASKYPECAPYKDALRAAGSDQNINPTFLGAIAMVESTCNPYPGNGFGPFQFMDNNAWNFYGGLGKDRQNFWDAAYGAARYFKALLAQDANNLNQAMRDWNGPVGSGGDPDYQSNAAAFMAGTR